MAGPSSAPNRRPTHGITGPRLASGKGHLDQNALARRHPQIWLSVGRHHREAAQRLSATGSTISSCKRPRIRATGWAPPGGPGGVAFGVGRIRGQSLWHPRQPVGDALAAGPAVLLEIELEGAVRCGQFPQGIFSC